MMFSVEVGGGFGMVSKVSRAAGSQAGHTFAATLFVPGGGKPERRNDKIKVSAVSTALHRHSVITPPGPLTTPSPPHPGTVNRTLTFFIIGFCSAARLSSGRQSLFIRAAVSERQRLPVKGDGR